MKTVKEFRDAGLVFVEGDMAIGSSGPCFNKMHKKQRHWTFNRVYGNDTCTEFAWRINTGEKPSFSGDVEVELENGYTREQDVSRFLWAKELYESYRIVRWRPVISDKIKMEGKANNPRANERVDIPECKPIYTQAMHDAGELPPIGSKFMLAKRIECKRLDQFQGVECTVIGHCKNLRVADVITFSHPMRGLACMCHLPEFIKPIDTRTDKEKLIDEACDLVAVYDDEPLKHHEKTIVELMIKAGYRKHGIN